MRHNRTTIFFVRVHFVRLPNSNPIALLRLSFDLVQLLTPGHTLPYGERAPRIASILRGHVTFKFSTSYDSRELEDAVGFVTRNIISTDSATFLHRGGNTRRIPWERGER